MYLIFSTLQNPSAPHPALIFDEMKLSMVTFDNQIVENVASFTVALCCIVALYWVFNIEFPSAQKRFLTILAKYIFGIPGIDYMPSALRIMNSL